MATTQWRWQRLSAGQAGGSWLWTRLSVNTGAPANGAWRWTRLSISTGSVPAVPGGAWQWRRLAIVTGASSPPNAVLGPDVLDIEPYSIVTIDCSASSDPDGTIVTYTLLQTFGPPVSQLTGTGPIFTYKAPGNIDGATVAWQLNVTDNNNLQSPPDASTHYVLPVNEMAAVGGVWVPLEMSTISS